MAWEQIIHQEELGPRFAYKDPATGQESSYNFGAAKDILDQQGITEESLRQAMMASNSGPVELSQWAQQNGINLGGAMEGFNRVLEQSLGNRNTGFEGVLRQYAPMLPLVGMGLGAAGAAGLIGGEAAGLGGAGVYGGLDAGAIAGADFGLGSSAGGAMDMFGSLGTGLEGMVGGSGYVPAEVGAYTGATGGTGVASGIGGGDPGAIGEEGLGEFTGVDQQFQNTAALDAYAADAGGAATAGSGAGALAGAGLAGAAVGSAFPWTQTLLGGLHLLGLENYRDDITDAMNRAVDKSDPFASQRPMYQDMYKQANTDPNWLQNDAVLQNLTKAGLRATAASDASKGYMDSGNILHDLTRTGTETAANYALPRFDMLGRAAGAYTAPQNVGPTIANMSGQAGQAQLSQNRTIGNVAEGIGNYAGVDQWLSNQMPTI
jgi:hypothetical protein